jgi:predicted DNA-binding transcriptional regulator AlpA
MTEFQKADIEKLAECVAERILAFLDANKESSADDALVDISGALKILGISRSQFYRLLAQNALTPVRIDNRPRFRRAEIRSLIRSSTEPA